jgi:hypothetical protein
MECVGNSGDFNSIKRIGDISRASERRKGMKFGIKR